MLRAASATLMPSFASTRASEAERPEPAPTMSAVLKRVWVMTTGHVFCFFYNKDVDRRYKPEGGQFSVAVHRPTPHVDETKLSCDFQCTRNIAVSSTS